MTDFSPDGVTLWISLGAGVALGVVGLAVSVWGKRRRSKSGRQG